MNYETSESVKAIAPAIIAAQAEIEGAATSAENPHFKSKFAPLDEVWKAAKPALVEHKLAITQHPVSDENGKPGLRTVVWHESGEWIASTIYTAPEKNNAQGVGSVMTYLRRYSLQAVLGICPEDDDGNAASGKADINPVTPEEMETFEADIHFSESMDDLIKVAKSIKQRGVAGEDRQRLMEKYDKRRNELNKEAAA